MAISRALETSDFLLRSKVFSASKLEVNLPRTEIANLKVDKSLFLCTYAAGRTKPAIARSSNHQLSSPHHSPSNTCGFLLFREGLSVFQTPTGMVDQWGAAHRTTRGTSTDLNRNRTGASPQNPLLQAGQGSRKFPESFWGQCVAVPLLTPL